MPRIAGRGKSLRARTRAEAAARQLLETGNVPYESEPVSSLPGAGLSQPGLRQTCDVIIDASHLYLVSASPAAATTYLLAHVPPGLHQLGNTPEHVTDHGKTIDWAFADLPVGSRLFSNMLVFTYTQLSHQTGLRVDALTIPSEATCEDPGGPMALNGGTQRPTG